MRFSQLPILLVFICALFVTSWPSETLAQDESRQIGFVIAAQGEVSITSKLMGPRPALLRQNVFLNDTIQTGPKAAVKFLFVDNTVLSVTENSNIEITKFSYDPSTLKRHTIFKMAQGRAKVLVADFYAATDSRFEVHTPTAVVAAYGTEFVVWTFQLERETVTGIAVTVGSVTVTDVFRKSMTVDAGEYIVAAHSFPLPLPSAIARQPAAAIQQQVAEAEVETDPAVVAQVKTAQEVQAAQPIAPVIPGQQPFQLGAGGISRQMGTTNTPCQVVSGSGNVPLGCTPR